MMDDGQPEEHADEGPGEVEMLESAGER